jgi:sugar O-acyltransferase (sialic acid O-acetyltransferase NeuD family)
MSAPLVLLGAGGHARACIDVIEQEGRFTIVGLLGTAAEVGGSVLGYGVLGVDAALEGIRHRAAHAIVTVGQIKSPEPRIRLFTQITQSGWELPIIVSPLAHVSRHAEIGAGSIVMHGAIVNAGARVGRNCIVNTNALVEHDAVLEDHCHLATSATLNSGVQVGAASFIGSGTSVRQGIVIGERCVIGLGQRVVADCPPGSRLPAWRDA